ncbi:MAG: sensor domain-containing diguanylate cyclase [FCB group bacterium]|nr:sensor domain-containing diguanylate cyclase [FCB group bacterium]
MDSNYQSILNHLYDGVYFVDKNRKITYWNQSAEKITGYKASEVTNSFCHDNILNHVDANGTALCQSACPLQKTIEDGEMREADIFLHHKNGHRIPVSIRVIPLTNAKGDIIGGAEMFTETSSRDALEARIHELEKLALLDGLTQLSNRTHILSELEARMHEIRRYDLSVGVLFFDIDNFKRFNDTYGHAAGDEVLRGVARTLNAIARPFDLYGRYGGEEFVSIIRNVNKKTLNIVGERVRKMIAQTTHSFNDITESVTVSVGGTLVRKDDTVKGVIARADRLMYQSKLDGRNRFTMG